MDGLIAKPMGLFGSSPSAPSVALPTAVAPQLHFGSPEFSVRRKWHCSHAVQILSSMSDLNVFCHEHCRNWTGGSFFTHCFKPLSIWQAAPQSPVFALAQGHAANVSLAFTLAVWLRHMTPHHYPAPQYVTVPTQSSFFRALVLGGGSQFLKSWFWFFFLSCSKKQHRLLQSWIKKSSCYAHCVRGDFTHLHSHSTHSQHVNQGHNLSDMYKQRNYMTCQALT